MLERGHGDGGDRLGGDTPGIVGLRGERPGGMWRHMGVRAWGGGYRGGSLGGYSGTWGCESGVTLRGGHGGREWRVWRDTWGYTWVCGGERDESLGGYVGIRE